MQISPQNKGTYDHHMSADNYWIDVLDIPLDCLSSDLDVGKVP